ncbi:hypothetical protein J6590_096211 [Homalodisca vitripennis]|nr:hypothetical protein J6590_096211 [Homalodisca vitripennis]
MKTGIILIRRFPRAALRIGYPGVRSTIYKHRQRGNPPIPRSLEEFSTILLGDQWRHLSMTIEGGDEPLFRGVVGGEAEGWTAAIYDSLQLRTALVNTQRLHVDGTYKVLPEQLHAYQLVTIHGEFLNHTIYRMHRQLRLQHLVDTNVEAAKTLQMLMSLALLPAERIALGLRVIAHYSVLHGLAARFRILLR